MQPRSLPHRSAVWLALLAVLALALVPTLSRAMAAAGVGGWVQVCTSQGMRWVSLSEGLQADAQAPQGEHPSAMLEACTLCSLAHDAPPLWSNLARPPLPMALASKPPRAFLHAPATPHAWRSAQPRAPPARLG